MSERPTTERLADIHADADALVAMVSDGHGAGTAEVEAARRLKANADALAAELLAVTERERALAEALQQIMECDPGFEKDIAAVALAAAAHGDTPEPPCDCTSYHIGGLAGTKVIHTAHCSAGAAEATEETS